MKVEFYDSIVVFLGFGGIGLQVPDLRLEIFPIFSKIFFLQEIRFIKNITYY